MSAFCLSYIVIFVSLRHQVLLLEGILDPNKESLMSTHVSSEEQQQQQLLICDLCRSCRCQFYPPREPFLLVQLWRLQSCVERYAHAERKHLFLSAGPHCLLIHKTHHTLFLQQPNEADCETTTQQSEENYSVWVVIMADGSIVSNSW